MSDHTVTFSGSFWYLCSVTTLLLSFSYLAIRFALLQTCASGFAMSLVLIVVWLVVGGAWWKLLGYW